MVLSCAAYNCTQRCDPGTTISFHRFPSGNHQLLESWIRAVKREKWKPTASSRICSRHFNDEDYEVASNGASFRKKLRFGAVPHVFDFPAHMKKAENAKHRPTRNSQKELSGERTVFREIQLTSSAFIPHIHKNTTESISVDREEMPSRTSETAKNVAGPRHSTTERGALENKPHLHALLTQKIMEENQSLLAKTKVLEQQLSRFKEQEVMWKKRSNVLKCRLQRREKILAGLQSVVATFKEDTEGDGEHAKFALKKLEGLPREIFENEIKNRGRKPGGRRYDSKIKEFALTLYYYSPAS